MTVVVSQAPQLPRLEDTAIGEPVSTSRISNPLGVTANHILGWLLNGVVHSQRAFAAQTATGTARIRTHRNPQCEYLDVYAVVTNASGEAPWIITARAGTGTTQVVASPPLSPSGYAGGGRYGARCPFSTADSDAVTVSVTITGASIQALAVYNVPRETLSTSDIRVEAIDSTHPRIGLLPERALAASSEAGPLALHNAVVAAWENYRPQHMSWWTWDTEEFSTTATSYGGKGSSSDVLGGQVPLFRARQKRSTDTSGSVTFWVWAWCDVSDPIAGEIKVTSTNPGTAADDSDTVAVTTTSGAWHELTVDVDCTTDAFITVECIRTSGTASIHVSAVSAHGAI